MIAENPAINGHDAASAEQSAWLARSGAATLLVLLIGLTPFVAGLMFRTYQYHVTPGWYEALRQMDIPFLLVEIGVIFWAHAQGLRFRPFFAALDKADRYAALIFFGTFWISSALISPQPAYSLIRLSYWLVHIGFAISVWHLLRSQAQAAVPVFAKWSVIGVALFVPLLTAHFAFAPDPADTPLGEIIWTSAVPGALSVRHLGIWTGGVLALWIGHCMWLQPRRTFNLRNWLATTLLMALMFWSGTRAAMVAVMAVLVIAIVAAWRLPSLKEAGAMLAAILVSIFLSTQAFLPDGSFGILQQDRYSLSSDANAMSSGRVELWIDALAKFAQNPLIGWGEGSIYWLIDLDGVPHLQPHNSVVQFLFSWGLIATAAAAFVMLRILWRLHIQLRQVPAMLAPLLLVDATLIMSLFDGALYFTRMIMPGALALALCLCLCAAAATEKA
jgi:exopolysaccharide production protein ExoQ